MSDIVSAGCVAAGSSLAAVAALPFITLATAALIGVVVAAMLFRGRRKPAPPLPPNPPPVWGLSQQTASTFLHVGRAA